MVQTAQIGRKLAHKRVRRDIENAAVKTLLTDAQASAQIVEVGAFGAWTHPQDTANGLQTRTFYETPTPKESIPPPDAENRALIALLQQWREEDAAMSEEEAAQADTDLAEFKANMNANRAATGESPVYR